MHGRILVLVTLLVLALGPSGSATPAEPPPERAELFLASPPVAGEWFELRGAAWLAYGEARTLPLTLELPPWIQLAEGPEWRAEARVGTRVERTWMARATHEGLWSAALRLDRGWRPGGDLVVWSGTEGGGSYDDMPAPLARRIYTRVLDDGRVDVTLVVGPSGAWAKGAHVEARLWPTGPSYGSPEAAYDGPLADGKTITIVLTPDAAGYVGFQDSTQAILSFDGPAGGTHYRRDLVSVGHRLRVLDGALLVEDAYSTVLDGSPGRLAAPQREVPAASWLLVVATACAWVLSQRR